MLFQRTAYRAVVSAVLSRLLSAGLNSTWIGIKQPTEMWLGDYLLSICPGAAAVDEGTATGTGVCGSLIRRPVRITLMTRSYEDEGERAQQALYEHLDREEALLTLLHLWMPTDANGILVEPMRLQGISDPDQSQGVIRTVFTFEATYPAMLQYSEYINQSIMWGDGAVDTINWGANELDTLLFE